MEKIVRGTYFVALCCPGEKVGRGVKYKSGRGDIGQGVKYKSGRGDIGQGEFLPAFFKSPYGDH